MDLQGAPIPASKLQGSNGTADTFTAGLFSKLLVCHVSSLTRSKTEGSQAENSNRILSPKLDTYRSLRRCSICSCLQRKALSQNRAVSFDQAKGQLLLSRLHLRSCAFKLRRDARSS